MNNRLNKYKYPGAKRLMLEAQELKDKTEDYCAQPIEDNLFEWHFTVRGPPETAFEGGFYHGRLSFPTEYPMKPPSIILLTPNGRFETNKKICLSISGHHPETWQPSWSVRTALLALVAFMPTKANRAIGSLDFSDAERKKLAKNSKTWRCETCGPIKDLLKQPGEDCDVASACEASTSRVTESCSLKDSERQDNSQSLASDRSDSDGETRSDISTDSQGSGKPATSTASSSSSNGSDSDASTSTSSSSSSGGRTKPEETRGEGSRGKSIRERQSDSKPTATSEQQLGHESSSEPGVVEQHQSTPISNSRSSTTTSASGQTITAADENRSYPPLVFISISVLLFLLILRRVVMMIQA